MLFVFHRDTSKVAILGKNRECLPNVRLFFSKFFEFREEATGREFSTLRGFRVLFLYVFVFSKTGKIASMNNEVRRKKEKEEKRKGDDIFLVGFFRRYQNVSNFCFAREKGTDLNRTKSSQT